MVHRQLWWVRVCLCGGNFSGSQGRVQLYILTFGDNWLWQKLGYVSLFSLGHVTSDFSADCLTLKMKAPQSCEMCTTGPMWQCHIPEDLALHNNAVRNSNLQAIILP
jgi:hypothetical protein